MGNVKWGIIGLGSIAHQFCEDLALVADAEIYAVASRDSTKAEEFQRAHKAIKAYGNYEALLKDPDVDIIYVATPHSSHATWSIAALEHGKHVLCEKPIALNYSQASQMIQASKKAQKFFMEAFWTRFNPTFKEVLSKVQNGAIGTVNYVNAEFSFPMQIPNESRMTDLDLGGGSLLDMGVYPLFLSYMIFGKPQKILASSSFFETGADQQTSIILQYDHAQAIHHSSFMSATPMRPTISGTEGYITIDAIWHEAQGYSITKNDQEEKFQLPTLGKGFTYEIEECHSCIQNNKIESRIWSHENSLELIAIVDEVRVQTGLKFPVAWEI